MNSVQTWLLNKLEDCDIIYLLLQPTSAQKYLLLSREACLVLTPMRNSVLAPSVISPVTRALSWRDPTMLNAQLLENGQQLHQPAKVKEYTLTETAFLPEISSKITNT